MNYTKFNNLFLDVLGLKTLTSLTLFLLVHAILLIGLNRRSFLNGVSMLSDLFLLSDSSVDKKLFDIFRLIPSLLLLLLVSCVSLGIVDSLILTFKINNREILILPA